MSPAARIVLLVALVTTAAPVSAAVYHCRDEEGVPTFSQFPCGSTPGAERPLPQRPLATIRTPPLAAAERRRLDAMARKLETRRRQRERSDAQVRQQAQRREAARARACDAARSGLTALARQRRSGYPLRQAQALDRREAELKHTVRKHC